MVGIPPELQQASLHQQDYQKFQDTHHVYILGSEGKNVEDEGHLSHHDSPQQTADKDKQ